MSYYVIKSVLINVTFLATSCTLYQLVIVRDDLLALIMQITHREVSEALLEQLADDDARTSTSQSDSKASSPSPRSRRRSRKSSAADAMTTVTVTARDPRPLTAMQGLL